MAYIDSLPDFKRESLWDALTAAINTEHEAAYQSRFSQAKTKKQKESCAGRYEGSWYRFRNSWEEGKISNIEVKDALVHGFVPGDVDGVIFCSAGKTKKIKKK